ncbi:MAG: DUF805 domain-containing protein [Balneolaceae bacterium]|nr:DUF805 domain-containing protein [Balneolaceae bacterium]MCH8548849.1 DUF805 domain-containing protein [Balneolaceae bacterium]
MEDIIEWYKKPFQKFLVFEGRSRRKEYWTFVLVNFVISLILGGSGGLFGTGMATLSGLFSLIILIPSITVGVRRLHDTGKSGLWLLIGLIPVIGLIVLIIFMVQDSEPGSNQYGANPKAAVNY